MATKHAWHVPLVHVGVCVRLDGNAKYNNLHQKLLTFNTVALNSLPPLPPCIECHPSQPLSAQVFCPS